MPVFSACGRGERPEIAESGTIDPFGDDSIFARLIGADGALVFYGAPFHSITLIHHVERLSGGPVYRYDKTFAGTVTDGVNAPREIVLNYHVRPMGRALDYDWPRLTADLTEAGVLREVRDEASVVLVMPAAALTRFWLSAMKTDPLYLLDAQSRSWAAPMFERLGRRFRLEDFE